MLEARSVIHYPIWTAKLKFFGADTKCRLHLGDCTPKVLHHYAELSGIGGPVHAALVDVSLESITGSSLAHTLNLRTSVVFGLLGELVHIDSLVEVPPSFHFARVDVEDLLGDNAGDREWSEEDGEKKGGVDYGGGEKRGGG